MGERRDVKGIWVPIEIWEDEDLTPFEVMLLGEIDSFDMGEGCYKKDETLADRMKCSVSHLSNTLSSLRKRDYLFTQNDGQKRILRTCFTRHNKPTFKSRLNESPTAKSKNHLLPKVGHIEYSGDRRTKHSDSRSATQGSRASRTLLGEDAPFDKFITKCCHKLEDFVRAKNRFDPKHHNAQRWYDSIRRLLYLDLGNDRERLCRVLATYLEEEHDKYTPQADCGKSFRRKFPKIEQWAEQVNPEGACEPKIIEIIRER